MKKKELSSKITTASDRFYGRNEIFVQRNGIKENRMKEHCRFIGEICRFLKSKEEY